jgi:hypothetical protein
LTGYTLTQPEVWQAGPIAYQAAGNATVGWVQAAAVSVAAQSLVTAATGASGAAGSYQPWLPAGFWQRQGQHAIIKAHGLVSWVGTAGTTITFACGTSGSTPQGTATTITATNTFFTSQAYINGTVAQTNIPWHFELDLLCTKVGVGTTAVSTSILTTGFGGFLAALPANTFFGPVLGNVITTFDPSINQYVWWSVTFGTNSSASNTCTLLSCYIYGMN